MQPDVQKVNPGEDSDAEIKEMYAPEPDNDSELIGDDTQSAGYQSDPDLEPIYWSATEYTPADKNFLWFFVFALVVIALVAADILFLHYYTFSALIIVMALAIVVLTKRPSKSIQYTLSDEQGLYIGDILHPFNEYKSFSYLQDGNRHMIMLIPVKRFSLPTSVYFPEEAGEQIVDVFGARLPMENRKLDIVDVIVRKLRL